MLAARCLLAAALLAAASGETTLDVGMSVFKGYRGVALEDFGKFIIPDNQCTAVIYPQMVGCPMGLLALNVTAWGSEVPHVSVPDGLLPAHIRRARAACPGKVDVRVHAACRFVPRRERAAPPPPAHVRVLPPF